MFAQTLSFKRSQAIWNQVFWWTSLEIWTKNYIWFIWFHRSSRLTYWKEIKIKLISTMNSCIFLNGICRDYASFKSKTCLILHRLLYNLYILNCRIMLPKRNQSSILLLSCAPTYRAYVVMLICTKWKIWWLYSLILYLRGCHFMYHLNYPWFNMYQTVQLHNIVMMLSIILTFLSNSGRYLKE